MEKGWISSKDIRPISYKEKNLFNKIDIPAKSRWPLDSKAPYMKGPGLKL